MMSTLSSSTSKIVSSAFSMIRYVPFVLVLFFWSR